MSYTALPELKDDGTNKQAAISRRVYDRTALQGHIRQMHESLIQQKAYAADMLMAEVKRLNGVLEEMVTIQPRMLKASMLTELMRYRQEGWNEAIAFYRTFADKLSDL